MRTMMMVTALVSAALGLGFGCASEEPGAPPDDSLGQVEQEVGGPCRQNYECPLGERCDLTQPHPLGGGNSWTCVGYPVFGPSQNPCLDTMQCQFQYYWFSYCNRPEGASYGECIRQ
jgi:hypothetical protein